MYGEISIHVPAWGTTKIYCNYGCLSAISIHVPAWGTTDGNVISGYPDEFQSTFPRGERQNLSRNIFLKEYFNPRSRVGNDGYPIVYCCLEEISIHVPAWGTTKPFRNSVQRLIFQSTFPRGERPYKVSIQTKTNTISIHVPAWGTTGQHGLSRQETKISIHVPAWGTTPFSGIWNWIVGFQSTFPRGERRVPAKERVVLTRFQSTFPRGERQL